MTHSSTWKRVEYKAAEKLGGTRISRGDNFSQSDLDVAHDILAIDAKLRASWGFIGMYDKLVVDTNKLYPGKIPILVVKKKGRRGEFIIMDLDDFVKVVRPEIVERQGE